jgi:hypothetical protein
MTNNHEIRVGDEIAAVITAAISVYLGHRSFEIRSIKVIPNIESRITKK